MQYPVDHLRPLTGAISAMVFKNEPAGVEENLYWSVHIDFEPLEVEGSRDEPSLTAEWFVFPIRDWRDLENRSVQGDQDTVEASFYVFEHDLASWTRVVFGERTGYSFNVTLEMKVELLGLDASWQGLGPSIQDTFIRAQLSLPYEGFHIYPDVLEGLPEDKDTAREIASRYVDLGCYQDVEARGNWFVVAPYDSPRLNGASHK